MSQWKSYSSNVLENVKKDLLAKACADINVSFDENIKKVGNSYGERGTVDAAIIYQGKAIAMGFKFQEVNGKTKLVLEGDFYATGLNEKVFMDNLAQAYQKHNVIQQVEEQGWNIDSTTVDENGEILIGAYQWA